MANINPVMKDELAALVTQANRTIRLLKETIDNAKAALVAFEEDDSVDEAVPKR